MKDMNEAQRLGLAKQEDPQPAQRTGHDQQPNLDMSLDQRQQECLAILNNLLACEKLPFDETLHSALPELPGIYAVSLKEAETGEYLRAGRTKQGKDGLRQRIYRNHLMGN